MAQRTNRTQRQLPVPGLSNPIHPLLHRSLFPASFDYDGHKLAFQLASHFLEVPILQPFMYALLFGTVYEGPSHQRDGRLQHDVFHERPRTLSEDQKREVQVGLAALANSITFKTHNENRTSSHCQHEPNTTAAEPLLGCRSTIYLNETVLAGAHVSNRAGNHEVFLWHNYELASTILHEIVHAILLASDNHSVLDHPWRFVEGCETSEEGFESQLLVFGGIVQPLPRNQDAPVGANDCGRLGGSLFKLAPWPQKSLLDLYSNMSEDIRLTNGRDSLPPKVGWILKDPLHYLMSLFTDSFWQFKDTLSPTALYPAVDKDVRHSEGNDPISAADLALRPGPAHSISPINAGQGHRRVLRTPSLRRGSLERRAERQRQSERLRRKKEKTTGHVPSGLKRTLEHAGIGKDKAHGRGRPPGSNTPQCLDSERDKTCCTTR